MFKKSFAFSLSLIFLLFLTSPLCVRAANSLDLTISDGSITPAEQAKLLAQIESLSIQVQKLMAAKVNSQNLANLPNLDQLRPLSDFKDLKDLSRYLRGVNMPQYADFIDTVERVGATINDLKREFSSLKDLFNGVSLSKASEYATFLDNFGNLGGDLSSLLRNFGNLREMISSLKNLNNLKDLNRLIFNIKLLGGTLDQLLNGSPDLKSLLKSLDTLRNIAKIADTLSRLKDLGGNLNQILSQVGNIKNLVTSLSKLANLSQINDLLSSLKGLKVTLSDLLQGYNSLNDLLSSLNNLKDLGDVIKTINSLGQLGATIQDLTKSFGTIKEALSQISNLNLGNVASNLQEAIKQGLNISKLTDLMGNGSLSKSLQALSARSGALSGALGGSNLPFGGFTTAVLQCTCSGDYSLITMQPAANNLPRTLMYSPSKAITYEYGQIPQVGVYLLGTHAEDKVCKIYVGIGCTVAGVGKDIVMVGTSGGREGGSSGGGTPPSPPTQQEQFPMPPSTPPDQCKRMGDKAYVYNSRGTGYYPTPSATGSDENRLEGGPNDRLGAPLQTLQDYLEGKASYVSVAMDAGAFPYGTELCIPEFEAKYGRQIVFRVVDTGGDFVGQGTSRIDVCTRNRQYSEEAPPNGSLTLVSALQSAR